MRPTGVCVYVCTRAHTHRICMHVCVLTHTQHTHTHTHTHTHNRKNAELEGVAKERRAELAEKQAEEDERLRLEREHIGLVYWGYADHIINY